MSKIENMFNVLANGTIEVNKIEIRGHVAFGSILKNNNKADGLKLLLYIYLMADARSMYAHLSDEDRHIMAAKHIGYDTFWQPTPQVKTGIIYYKELLTISPTGKSLASAKRALYETGEDTNEMLDNMVYFKTLLKKRITELKNSTDIGDNERDEKITACNSLMKGIIENQKELTKQIKELPSLLKTVEELGIKWANEGNGVKEIYGGGTLGNRE